MWSSGSFLDPTIEADCGFCGESLIHRRSLPDGGIAHAREAILEQLPVPARIPVA
jgi:hypothetical protein